MLDIGNPTPDNPILDFPIPDYPTSENPMQLNKDILNTDLQNGKVKYTKRIYNLPDKVYQFCIRLYVGESGHNSQYQAVLMCHAFNVSSVISNYYTLFIALSIARIKPQISTSPYSIRFYLINGFR